MEPQFTDARGEIRDLVVGKEIDAVTTLTSIKGAVRGNHYHEHSEQWEYVLSGSFELASQLGPQAHIEKAVITAGDLVYHPVLERHALKALEDSVLLVMTKGPRRGRDYERDVIRLEKPILE